jgi:hypothetical protein
MARVEIFVIPEQRRKLWRTSSREVRGTSLLTRLPEQSNNQTGASSFSGSKPKCGWRSKSQQCVTFWTHPVLIGPPTARPSCGSKKTSKHLGGCRRPRGVANRRSRNWGSVLLHSSLHTLPNGADAERVGVAVWHSFGTTGASLVATLEGGMQKGAWAGSTGWQNRYESYWPPEVLLDSRHEYEPEHGDV